MPLRASVLVVALLAGCAGGERCSAPASPPGAALLRLGVADGAVRARTVLPYFDEVLVRRGVVSIAPPGGTPTPVATVSSPAPQASRRQPPPGWPGTPVATVGGVTVVLGRDSQLRGVRESDGRPLWNTRLDHRLFATVAVPVGDRVVAAGWPASGPDDTERPGEVYAVDARTGRLVWRTAGPLRAAIRRLLVAGTLVVTAYDGDMVGSAAELRGTDVRTGRRVWSATLPHDVVASVELSAGELVVTARDSVPGCE